MKSAASATPDVCMCLAFDADSDEQGWRPCPVNLCEREDHDHHPDSSAASPSPQPFYQDDSVTLYHGDCRQIIPTLGPVDLLVTDPPYPGFDKGWDIPDVAAILGWICAPTKVVFWPPLCPSPLASHTAEHVWHKPNGRSSQHYERVIAQGGSAVCRVYREAAILPNYTQYAAEAEDHPTQKPVKLLRKLIGAYDGRLVLDPFAGSGTTLRAAKDLGRQVIRHRDRGTLLRNRGRSLRPGGCWTLQPESSAAQPREYEVEVVLIATAPSIQEARESLTRSGVVIGRMIGETTISDVLLYGREDDE